MFSSLYAKVGIGLLAAILIGLAAFTLNKMVNKIADQGKQIAQLETDLKTEQDARKADVAGLTTLSRGVVAASSARALDDKVLSETIDAKNPHPSSPELSNFLDGLRREAGSPGPAAKPASRTGSPAGSGTGRSVH